ncbi:MAG: nickel pincer cofactor biosynthesis protein LarB [Sporomusaceae bacterium]|nr:nickel pincer cofactor biosynthesis protein LarB [Sporomusaceae bacterium]
MEDKHLLELLESYRLGQITAQEGVAALRSLPYEDLGFAKIDHHRVIRQGFPEVIFCQGKTPGQVAAIASQLAGHNNNLLATRADPAVYEAVKQVIPDAVYYEQSRLITVQRAADRVSDPERFILVISAGTSDIPVAEEAAITAEMMGNTVKTVYDVGVAGIHRLLSQYELLRQANVVVVVAGMEGALASVVGGMVAKPVIAVPTSVGYGASFGGVAALLAMLNSCAAGIAVVNIDNGFGGGRLASMINQMR